MDKDRDRRLTDLLDSFLDERPGAGTDETVLCDAPALDYLEQYAKSLPDIPESAAERVIRSKTESLLDAFLEKPDQLQQELSMKLRVRVEDGQNGIGDSASDDEAANADVPKALDEAYLTETLACIYMKQHRYEKALEIIRSLYLNFPNKSIYFADQIRYLEKLIRINLKN